MRPVFARLAAAVDSDRVRGDCARPDSQHRHGSARRRNRRTPTLRASPATTSRRGSIPPHAPSKASRPSPGGTRRPSPRHRCSSTCITTRGGTRIRPGCVSSTSPGTRLFRKGENTTGGGSRSRFRACDPRRPGIRPDLGDAIHRPRRRQSGRPHGGRDPARHAGGGGPVDRGADDVVVARYRARSREPARSATTTSSRSGFRRSGCCRTTDGTATSSTPARSSSPTSALTTCG